jgi:hypothetical protein
MASDMANFGFLFNGQFQLPISKDNFMLEKWQNKKIVLRENYRQNFRREKFSSSCQGCQIFLGA